MTRWEYARLESTAAGISVVFTHRQPWVGLAPEAFFDTLRRLGDEGWEVVAALPLGGSAAFDGYDGEPGQDRPDRAERYGQRESPDRHRPERVRLQVGTDRWLLFKRPQPEPPADQGSGQGADVLKGLVGRQLLRGKVPLP